MTTMTTSKPATAKQIDFLVSLSSTRTPHVTEDAIRTWGSTATSAQASDKITMLKALAPLAVSTAPATAAAATAPAVEVPEGRYAVVQDGTLKFFKVDRPTEGKWAGYTFVKVQASDEFYPVKGAGKGAALALIAVDPKAAMLRYGTELGSCGHCGRTLTNEESRALGIGPVCAAKMGF